MFVAQVELRANLLPDPHPAVDPRGAKTTGQRLDGDRRSTSAERAAAKQVAKRTGRTPKAVQSGREKLELQDASEARAAGTARPAGARAGLPFDNWLFEIVVESIDAPDPTPERQERLLKVW